MHCFFVPCLFGRISLLQNSSLTKKTEVLSFIQRNLRDNGRMPIASPESNKNPFWLILFAEFFHCVANNSQSPSWFHLRMRPTVNLHQTFPSQHAQMPMTFSKRNNQMRDDHGIEPICIWKRKHANPPNSKSDWWKTPNNWKNALGHAFVEWPLSHQKSLHDEQHMHTDYLIRDAFWTTLSTTPVLIWMHGVPMRFTIWSCIWCFCTETWCNKMMQRRACYVDAQTFYWLVSKLIGNEKTHKTPSYFGTTNFVTTHKHEDNQFCALKKQ